MNKIGDEVRGERGRRGREGGGKGGEKGRGNGRKRVNGCEWSGQWNGLDEGFTKFHFHIKNKGFKLMGSEVLVFASNCFQRKYDKVHCMG